MSGAAVVAAGTGAVLLVADAKRLALPGAVCLVAGGLGVIPVAILDLTADTHMWNAINHYNDDLSVPNRKACAPTVRAPRPRPAPPTAPAAAPPPVTSPGRPGRFRGNVAR